MAANDRYDQLLVWSDGAARGNPGPAALGIVIRDAATATVVRQLGRYLSDRLTNNEAEYLAFQAAVLAAASLEPGRVTFHTDSALVANQLDGRWKIREERLRAHHDRIRELLTRLPAYSIVSVPRARNRQADTLANRALDGFPIDEPLRHGG